MYNSSRLVSFDITLHGITSRLRQPSKSNNFNLWSFPISLGSSRIMDLERLRICKFVSSPTIVMSSSLHLNKYNTVSFFRKPRLVGGFGVQSMPAISKSSRFLVSSKKESGICR
ncbi:hypothetical protein L6164_000754 [Bauhinia variegata]|uniref:Uncharacterized protein n=1 Tax=Bauhinia variegata TaxID=167791 RepID=A0ACB9Q829_BAUVA|nr:hypothetical protein L6164_000754 [Bauhinia variegata]